MNEQYIRILFMHLIKQIDCHPQGWLYYNEYSEYWSAEYMNNDARVFLTYWLDDNYLQAHVSIGRWVRLSDRAKYEEREVRKLTTEHGAITVEELFKTLEEWDAVENRA